MNPSKKILVTGANGQLGKCLQDMAAVYSSLQFVFTSKEELDIQNESVVADFFEKNKFSHCINCAAYTHVEKAESEPEKAFAVNAEAVRNLAEICKDFDVVLLHISTDYVFDGEKTTSYSEEDQTNPINVYGASKLKGEKYIQRIWKKHFIFRTSWLYSQYGHNFYQTILRYANEGKSLTITTEQTGTPTNANDLAKVLLKVIIQDKEDFGVYHFSNAGETTWYGFAKAILEFSDKLNNVKLAKTNHYRTFARRPVYSVLDSTKTIENLKIQPKNWQESLRSLIETTN